MLGLVWGGVYVGDSATAEMLRGLDAVTLLVVAPALVLALRAARHGSPVAGLVTASLLLYLAYTYAYHLFGTGVNNLLLLHAVVFAGSLAGLVLTLVSLCVEATPWTGWRVELAGPGSDGSEVPVWGIGWLGRTIEPRAECCPANGCASLDNRFHSRRLTADPR